MLYLNIILVIIENTFFQAVSQLKRPLSVSSACLVASSFCPKFKDFMKLMF